MNRRTLPLAILFLAIVLAVTGLLMRWNPARSKVGATFVNSEPGYSPFPSMVQSDRLAFDVWNGGSKSAFLSIQGIEDAHGKWLPTNYMLGEVEVGQSNQYYLYVSPHSEPRSVKIRVSEKASALYKSQFAMRLLMQRAKGRYQGKQFWHDGLQRPVHELIVKLRKETDSSNPR